jgi:hypothetical protein
VNIPETLVYSRKRVQWLLSFTYYFQQCREDILRVNHRLLAHWTQEIKGSTTVKTPHRCSNQRQPLFTLLPAVYHDGEREDTSSSRPSGRRPSERPFLEAISQRRAGPWGNAGGGGGQAAPWGRLGGRWEDQRPTPPYYNPPSPIPISHSATRASACASDRGRRFRGCASPLSRPAASRPAVAC